MIGDEIQITVVDIKGDRVRIGITAPTRIAVHRKEVYEAIKREHEKDATLGQVVAKLSTSEQISAGPPKDPQWSPKTYQNGNAKKAKRG